MPIEIKELNIKINVEEKPSQKNSQTFNPIKIKELKAEMIRSCTKNVIEYIKERQQR